MAYEVLRTKGMAEERLAMGKAGLITKALDRCWSTTARNSTPAEGCFSVYVDVGRQRFVVRTECVNHPLFGVLLEEAKEMFGYAATGALELPCNSEAFAGVLEQIEEEMQMTTGRRYGLPRGSSYQLLGTGQTVIISQS
ncbi:indole-3-acetic acid-induced protein ARG7-like [Aegilops tauschii subsp. strangulata]|uniref:Auxin-induced protein 6B n=1 Tax=Aegilops tauschii TaxID=37682 RepID=R7WDH1_AEGTA|nr:auxin-responsive protein SAUR72-like [Aegilops tauschii subsp. strangulata]